MINRITSELREHAPFTALGTAAGIIVIIIFTWGNVPPRASETLFYTMHPLHVVLSAIATTAMYKQYAKAGVWMAILIGYPGSIGIATISDSIIPYVGEILLGLPHAEEHIGFIEKWWLVNPLALIGVAIGYFRPTTKFPHAGHVLLSTFASLFHVTMALGETVNWIVLPPIFLFLFFAVWGPCCLSDIIYPLMFVRKGRAFPSQHSHRSTTSKQD